jgi:hypothetical protein
MISKFAIKCISVFGALLSIVVLNAGNKIRAQAPISSADVFGQCVHPSNLDIKIAACTAASKATSYPWILHWVYRELARAHRDRGESDKAITNYARSLSAREDMEVRREMESLAPITQ